MLNRKELQLKILVNSSCTHTKINKQLVKEEKIKIKPINRLFKMFNTDKTKNRKVTRFASLKLEINKHKKYINIAVMDLNNMNIFLEYDQLVKYNPEVNWSLEIIYFIKCLKEYRI